VLIRTRQVRAGQVPSRALHLNFTPVVPGLRSISEWAAKRLVQAHYYAWPLPPDWGKAVCLKQYVTGGGDEYDVVLDGERSACACNGLRRWGHDKHLAAGAELAGRGAR
jgi:hypothetical protein